MQINILNNNGIINVYGDYPVPRSYYGDFGKSGKFYPYNGDRYIIFIDQDVYDTLWTDLLVNNVLPTDYENAALLLSQIFSSTPPSPTPLAIGDPYQGGIIFYLDGTGQHGLIRAVDAGLGIGNTTNFYAWFDNTSSPNFVLTNAVGTAIGTGQSNTDLIIAADHNSQAAKYCVDYTIDGYSDWYLPSYDEMLAMINNGLYPNFDSLGASLPFAWSSTEFDIGTAYLYDSISIIPVGKNLPINVIPIRTF
jgi:hypothetical protein